MRHVEFIQGLLSFLRESPTPFHAVGSMVKRLIEAGFGELKEGDHWDLHSGQRYFVTRNGSSIIAFKLGRTDLLESGISMVGAHTDSPCLKVKPNPERISKNYFQLGVEVYGGALLAPWFDRDLSIAGRVSYLGKDNSINHVLIDFQDPIVTIPSLAIHLDREVNEGRRINAQTQMPPVVCQVTDGAKVVFRDILLQQLFKQNPDCAAQEVLDYELSLYDTQAPALVGLNQEFICSARLDNLLSCYVGLMSILGAAEDQTSLLICSDHEEVGSLSSSGANGPFLKSVLERMVVDAQTLTRVIDRSYLVSADNAHGVHPNFTDKHDDTHGPLLNNGPVIKVNANQRYATNSETSSLFRSLCKRVGVPVQSFAMRSDMQCGSTIGPITAGGLGIKTVDVGVPQFAMHSIRETAGVKDGYSLYRVLTAFFGGEVKS